MSLLDFLFSFESLSVAFGRPLFAANYRAVDYFTTNSLLEENSFNVLLL